MRKLALHLPINSVSFGQVSILLLRTLFERDKAGQLNLDLYIFPIGGVDISTQANDIEFANWVQGKINKAYESYTRDIPVFKLWHLNGSLESVSSVKQTLLTFYELDNPTRIEQNIAKNNNLCLSSEFACNVFKMFGVDANFMPLAFDHYNFKQINRPNFNDGRIVFNLCGKLERRKHHSRVIQAWIKKYGQNPRFALQCAVYNIFLGANPAECDKNNNELIGQILGGPKPFNVNFYPRMGSNAEYNQFLNSADIIIGMSGGEGWGLPEFQSVALGKHAILLRAHSYTSWATPTMATFVEPSGKIPAVDNMFFKNGDAFNQGNIFDWSEDAFIAACEETVRKVEANRTNTEGLALQQTFNSQRFADDVIKTSLA